MLQTKGEFIRDIVETALEKAFYLEQRMNVEIRKVANGYMITPVANYRIGEAMNVARVWVFRNYQELTDKLQEILETPDVQS